jgi:glycosyltransferase involved in cell wall biosynthesis
MFAATRLGRPLVYQVQDWWPRCARANLVQGDGSVCPGPAPTRCARCLPLTGLAPRAVLNPALYLLRDLVLRRALARADAYVMGSDAILAWFRRHGGLAAGVPAFVLPYGVPEAVARPRPAASLPLRFGVIGSIMPHKGIQVAVAACRGLDPARARLTVWGDTAVLPTFTAELERLAADAPVRFAGVFPEAERAAVFADLDLLLVPSIGLESFGIVAREALAAGVPVLASRVGALAELAVDGCCGALLEPGSIAELRAWVERLAADPAIVDRWRAAIPPPTTTAAHARAVAAVYDRVLRR